VCLYASKLVGTISQKKNWWVLVIDSMLVDGILKKKKKNPSIFTNCATDEINGLVPVALMNRLFFRYKLLRG
jgi:hypothetical protein